MKTSATKEKPLMDIDNLDTIQARIEFVRTTLGYPVNQLARLIGSRVETVEAICSGKTSPQVSFLNNFSEAFPVNKAWLQMGTGESPFTTDDLGPHMFNPKVGLAKNKEYTDEKFVERLKFVRAETGLTQSQFAIKCEVSRDIVSAVENARQSAPLYYIKALANQFHVNLHWLIMGVGDMYVDADLREKEKLKQVAMLKAKIDEIMNSD